MYGINRDYLARLLRNLIRQTMTDLSHSRKNRDDADVFRQHCADELARIYVPDLLRKRSTQSTVVSKPAPQPQIVVLSLLKNCTHVERETVEPSQEFSMESPIRSI